jgi:hypothetical protein
MQNKFEETSYGAHEGWYDRQYPDEVSRLKNIQTWKDGIANKGTWKNWRYITRPNNH